MNNTWRNTGLNPILRIGYGSNIMRGLIHFNINDIKKLIDDKTFANIDKLHFNLKMVNCFTVAENNFENEFVRNDKAKRASSFELILFKLPCEFDAGRGYDFTNDFWPENNKCITTDGSSWFVSKTAIPWLKYDEEYDPEKDKGGIYSLEYIESEYEKFKIGDNSIVIASQSFDFGNENLYMDITSYVLEAIKLNKNYGLCLAFAPFYEKIETNNLECVNFFTDHTNTFFHPFVEAVYEEYINDNRSNFTNSSNDKLYLSVYNDGIPTNLDNIPSCFINDTEVKVKQATKGVYYALNSKINTNNIEESISYDRWSKMSINNETIDDVEMQFYVNKKYKRLSIGNINKTKIDLIPTIYGINDNEDVNIGDIREINVEFIEKFSAEKSYLINNAEYRLYVKDGNREIDVIEYQPIELYNNVNFFNIYTMDLIPNKYYIDIKVLNGRENKIFKNVVRFNVVNNVTDRYQ